MSNTQRLFFKSPDGFPRQLWASDRERGQRLFRRFLKLNGISVSLLMENMLVLYAIRNGVSDGLVATIASFIHLTMPFMVVGKLSVSRIGVASTWGLGWFLRYVSASLMIVAPFLAGLGGQTLVTATILAGAFGFALFRSMGAVANTPLIGEVTTPEERGRFMSGNFVRANSTYLLSMAAVIMVLRSVDQIWVYQIVLGIGCAVGFYASTVLARIPESHTPVNSARISLAESFRYIWQNDSVRRLLFAWAAGFVSFVAVIPFSMITVKNGYGVSDYSALFFSLPLVAGGIASALGNGVIADRVGPRPLLILYTSGLFAVALFWAFAPSTFFVLPVGLAFFVAGLCKTGVIVTLGHYFLSMVDEDNRVGASLFMRILGGASAGLAGSVIGGSLLELLHDVMQADMDVYRTYFRLIIAVLAVLLIVVTRLRPLAEWRIRSILGLLLSPRDLRALFALNRLEKRNTSSEEVRQAERLGSLGSSLPEEELRELLYSPKLSVRVRALQALRNIRFGSTTEAAILETLREGEFTSAWIAADIAGERGLYSALCDLRNALRSEDAFLCGKAMVALVRLHDTESLPRITEQFCESTNPRIVIHGAHALAETQDPEHLLPILEKSLQTELPAQVRQETLIAAATLAGTGERFYRFVKRYRRNQQESIAEFLPGLEGQVSPPTYSKARDELEQPDTTLKYFRRMLSELSRDQSDPVQATVSTFLERHREDPMPHEVAFCVASILAGRNRPRPQQHFVD
jgi:HEAT repeat protein